MASWPLFLLLLPLLWLSFLLSLAPGSHSRDPQIIGQVVQPSSSAKYYHHDHDRHAPEYEPPEEYEPEYDRPEYDRPKEYESERSSPFIVNKPVKIFRTEAGVVSMLPREESGQLGKRNIGLSFIRMEPKALLLPQYVDGNCAFLVHTGRARLSWVEGADLREVDLEVGDVYRIKGGTVFYIFNTDDGQRLSIFSVCGTSRAFRRGMIQSFFVAGGSDPKTILSGFDDDVIATAMKVSREEVSDVLHSQNRGPIIFLPENSTTESQPAQRSRMLLRKYFPIFSKNPPKPYNILKKSPDFKNNNGWTVAVNGKDFGLLKEEDLGAFAANLKAGAMLAPHWNPKATEIGLITKGEGVMQIAFPNGTCALNKKVTEGTVFFVPQYYPMCQIASRSGPLEFMGFSTSAKRNHPQFLAGANSVLKAMDKEILAAAFDMPAEELVDMWESQQDAVILAGQVEEREEL